MKGTKCLRILVLLVFAASLTVLLMPAASMASFSVGDNFAQSQLDPVRFFVYDTDGDGAVSLSASSIVFSGSTYTLQYSYDGSTWTNFPSLTLSPITPNANGGKLVYLQLNGLPDVTRGDMNFQNYQSTKNGFDLFDLVATQWRDASNNLVGTLTISTAGTDNVAPVPIPATLLLFGSSLLCLFGVRRRKG